MFFVLSRAWDKEKIPIPHEESNLIPSNSGLRWPMLAPCRQIRSIIILVKNRANSRCAVVGFCKHSYCRKYRHSKWFVIKRNGLIVFWRTVYLISRDLFKVQMDKSPLVKWNIQTKNVFYNSETEQPPLLNWFNKNTINWSVNWSGSMSK